MTRVPVETKSVPVPQLTTKLARARMTPAVSRPLCAPLVNDAVPMSISESAGLVMRNNPPPCVVKVPPTVKLEPLGRKSPEAFTSRLPAILVGAVILVTL
jgi:hypothetical protein